MKFSATSFQLARKWYVLWRWIDHAASSITAQANRQIANPFTERLRLRIEVDEQETTPGLDVHGQQSIVGPVERLQPCHLEQSMAFRRNRRAFEEGVPMHCPVRSYPQLWYGHRITFTWHGASNNCVPRCRQTL